MLDRCNHLFLLFGCLACLVVTSVVNGDGRVFVLDLRNSSGLQGFRDAERACASRHARLASSAELRHAVVECFFSQCTRGWLYGGTVGTTVCNVEGSALKAVDVRTENATEDAAHLDAFCIKDRGVPCGDPPSFPNARLQEHSGYEMGDELLYTCVPGYVMPSGHSAFSLLCDSCGEWYGLVEICVKDETESHIDYEDKFTDSFGEAERHSERPEEAHGEIYEEVHRPAYPERTMSQEQQETSFSVEGEEEHQDQHREPDVAGELIVRKAVEGESKEEERAVEDSVGHARWEQERREVVTTVAVAATEAPVSLLSQKHLFWFPSFQDEGHPVSTNPATQTTQRASGAQSEESKEQESQETHHHQRPVDVDDHESYDDHDTDDQDDRIDSNHDDLDAHDDSHPDDQDDHESHQDEEEHDDDRVKHYIPAQHDDLDRRDRYKSREDHDDHYDMGEHEDDRDRIRYGSQEYDDRDDTYDEHESYEEHEDVTDDHSDNDQEERPDGSPEHPDRDDHDDHDDHDDGEEHYDLMEDDKDHNDHDDHEPDDHDHYDDHDSYEDVNGGQHVIYSLATDDRQNITQKGEAGKATTDETWLDGYPVVPEKEQNGDSTTERVKPADRERGTAVRTTDRPNEVEIRRPVPYTSLPEVPESPTTEPFLEQGGVEEKWPAFIPTAAPFPDHSEPSDSPSYSLDYDTQQAAPTDSWLGELTEHPFLDHHPAPPVHDDDIVMEEHTVYNLPGETGERGEMEGEIGETICTGENCPPPSSSNRGPTVAAIIAVVCVVAAAVIVGVWCYRRQQQKSSMYEMNGKGQSQTRQGQQIEMQQKV
ncbi:sushi domain-containing protein 5 [Larimichthys crocea]|uniref:sushi domain-containing protein 5 n=1 Tax=Larimichthys crocea TaxID=215358 RepID=UPI0009010A22|nr:sushi domain-containing protein 5 [Larimichthys crocea]